jgi:hypothetical protein
MSSMEFEGKEFEKDDRKIYPIAADIPITA